MSNFDNRKLIEEEWFAYNITYMTNENFKIILGKNISYVRKLKSISQEDLAWKIGKSRNTVSNIERGTNSATLETYVEIAAALDVSVADLFTSPVSRNRNKDTGHKIKNIVKKLEDLDNKTLDIILKQINLSLDLKNKSH